MYRWIDIVTFKCNLSWISMYRWIDIVTFKCNLSWIFKMELLSAFKFYCVFYFHWLPVNFLARYLNADVIKKFSSILKICGMLFYYFLLACHILP